MAEENSDYNKIEIFRPGEFRVERRRNLATSLKAQQVEKTPDLVAGWKIIRRRRGIVLIFLSLFLAIVLTVTLTQKPLYRAKALLEIDKENPGLVTPAELLEFDEVSDAYLETQYKVLESDDLAQRVIDQLGLSHVQEFLPWKPSWRWLAQALQALRALGSQPNEKTRETGLREAVLSRFQDHLNIKPIRHSRAVELTFDSQDPNLAAQIVNTLTASYIQKNLEARWDATQKSSDWLSTQLQDLKTKLANSEDALQRYATENGLLFLETAKGTSESAVNQSFRDLQDELTKAQADRYDKESLYRIRNSTDYGSMPGVSENKVLQDLSVRLADLQREHAQLAATFTEDYPKVKQTQNQIVEIQAALDREHQHAVEKISNDYYASLRRESLLQSAFAAKQKEVNVIAEKSVQYEILSHEVDSNKNMYDGLLQRLKEAGVSAGLRATNIRVVDPGKVPYKPDSPKLLLDVGLATILGLGVGVCTAFVQEHVDQTFKNAKDVEQYLHVPALAFIPSLKSLNGRAKHGWNYVLRDGSIDLNKTEKVAGESAAIGLPHGDSRANRNAILAEAFRGLRTSVLLSRSSRPASSILVTSARAGEGKTTIAMNLAISLAHLGRRVLLIDADMRRPGVQKYFPGQGSRLSNCLNGQGVWQEMVRQTPTINLDVILAGPVPPNPSDLLSADLMRRLIREAATVYSFIILDSPPLLSVADSRILASMVDATVLVVKGADTRRQVVQYAESQVRSVGANLLGVVLNNLDVRLDEYPCYSSNRSIG